MDQRAKTVARHSKIVERCAKIVKWCAKTMERHAKTDDWRATKSSRCTIKNHGSAKTNTLIPVRHFSQKNCRIWS